MNGPEPTKGVPRRGREVANVFVQVRKLAASRISLWWVGTKNEPVDIVGVDAPDDIETDELRRMNRAIYIAMSQSLEGKSVSIFKNGEVDNGLDVWRRLIRRYDPRTASRQRSAYLRITQPGQAKTGAEAARMFEQWGTGIKQCEGKHGKMVDEDLKCAVLVEMMPKELRLHLQLNSKTLKTYAELRDAVLEFFETTNHKKKDDPTDVGALGAVSGGKQSRTGNCWECGRPGHRAHECRSGGSCPSTGKGKPPWSNGTGRKGSGKGKGSDQKGVPKSVDGTGKQKGKPGGKASPQSVQSYCFNCGRFGHRAADCRAKQANSFEADDLGHRAQTHDEPEVGGFEFELCSCQATELLERELNSLGQSDTSTSARIITPHQATNREVRVLTGKTHRKINCRQILRTIKATVDSGAAANAMPVKECEEYKVVPTAASEAGVHYKAGNGERVPDLGARKVDALSSEGLSCKLECAVAQIHKTLLSVAKIVDEQDMVHFGPVPKYCYIENFRPGKKHGCSGRMMFTICCCKC